MHTIEPDHAELKQELPVEQAPAEVTSNPEQTQCKPGASPDPLVFGFVQLNSVNLICALSWLTL
jgi:hypothetical protein